VVFLFFGKCIEIHISNTLKFIIMKKVILSASILVLGAIAANAQTANPTAPEAVKEVAAPAAVKA